MTGKREIATALADSTLSGELLRAPAKTVEETRLIVIPSDCIEPNMRKNSDMSIGQTDKSKEIIVYGRTISKRHDEEVASNLVARGHKNVKILKGGLDAWKKKHYPVEP
jgi:rhodanese-related sulfurtransferase